MKARYFFPHTYIEEEWNEMTAEVLFDEETQFLEGSLWVTERPFEKCSVLQNMSLQ